MAKKLIEDKSGKKPKAALDIAIEHIKGFATKGARAKSLGNVPTGHFELDFALHFGDLPGNKDLAQMPNYDPSKALGFPTGRLIEIFGDEGSGKSTLCYRVVGNAQKKGMKCLWIDAEQSFSESLATVNGVDLDELYLADKGSTMEQIMDNICNAIKAGMKVVIIDSVAGLVPNQRMEQDAENETMALKARILSDNLPKITTLAGTHNCLVIFINQVREKVGLVFGNKNTTQGGRALRFFSSVRLELTRRVGAADAIFIADPEAKKGRRYIGHKSGLKIEKNRFAKPLVNEDGKRVMLEVPIYFEPYFPDVAQTAFDVGRQLKLITVKKGQFTWEELTGTKEEVVKAIEEKSLLPQLIEEIKVAADEADVHLPVEITTYVPGKEIKRVIADDIEDDEMEDKSTKKKKKPKDLIVDDSPDVDLGDLNAEQAAEG